MPNEVAPLVADLVAAVAAAMSESATTLVTAESCTGGWIAKALTDRPGSSAWFLGGVVSYSDTLKTSLLDVPAALIAEHGAVSDAVVRAMAQGARVRFGADLAVATSGVAGPDGGTQEKPVGTVWVAWASAGATRSELLSLDGDREAVREATVRRALAGLVEVQR